MNLKAPSSYARTEAVSFDDAGQIILVESIVGTPRRNFSAFVYDNLKI
jgi:hypothetical protein